MYPGPFSSPFPACFPAWPLFQPIAEAIWEEEWLKGRLETTRDLLREALAERFGALPDAVLQRIESAADLDRLRVAVRQAVHLAAPDELQL
jgi:hypothetical protein